MLKLQMSKVIDAGLTSQLLSTVLPTSSLYPSAPTKLRISPMLKCELKCFTLFSLTLPWECRRRNNSSSGSRPGRCRFQVNGDTDYMSPIILGARSHGCKNISYSQIEGEGINKNSSFQVRSWPGVLFTYVVPEMGKI